MDPGWAFALGGLSASLIAVMIVLWRLPHIRRGVLAEYRDELKREARITAKEQLYRERDSFESAVETTRSELKELEERCRLRERGCDRRIEAVEERERGLREREAEQTAQRAQLDARSAEQEQAIQRQLRELERISGMRREEAEHLLLQRIEERCREEAEAVRDRAEGELQASLHARARDALLAAMQRLATGPAVEALVTSVPLPDELKGLLIGRDGRNARAFEAQTGVDLLVDDTPGAVLLSAFEPVRRELARRALLRLIEEGRIEPARIEAVVAETRQEMEDTLRQLGAAAAEQARVEELHPRLLTLLGRLEFRTAQGRNLRQQSVETALLASTLAGELELDPALARRCGLLHQVGRAVEQEVDGGFPAVGADFARRCNEAPQVVNAIAAQAADEPADSPYAALIQVASRVVAERPGVRDPMVELAVRRREELEAKAAQHPGVRRCYAVQAGRELRVIVDPAKVSDKGAHRLARDLARELEEGPVGPGEVKVTVIRELRSEETAE